MLNADIPIETINSILANGIPALSSAMGVTDVSGSRMATFNIIEKRPNEWGRSAEPYVTRWLHSDLKVMAYPYTYFLFKQLVTDGSLQ